MVENKDKHSTPYLAADALVVKNENGKSYLLMISRLHKPFGLAFPGGHIDYGEKCEDAVLRELREETSLIGKNPKLFGVYSDPSRDPRKHVVSIVYEVEVNDFSTLKADDDAKEANWYEFEQLVEMKDKIAFDHHQIILDFVKSKENHLKSVISKY